MGLLHILNCAFNAQCTHLYRAATLINTDVILHMKYKEHLLNTTLEHKGFIVSLKYIHVTVSLFCLAAALSYLRVDFGLEVQDGCDQFGCKPAMRQLSYCEAQLMTHLSFKHAQGSTQTVHIQENLLNVSNNPSDINDARQSRNK